MKYSSLSFSLSANVGDHVQSIAIERLLPRLDTHIDRSFLSSSPTEEPTLLVMNCWFSNCTTAFPPAKGIVPVFFGFHIHEEEKGEFLTPASIDYLRQHQPIGCRDHGTAKMLEAQGIKTFYSKCLTLTLPRREQQPKDGIVVVVDAYDIPLPSEIAKNAVHISHIVPVVLGETTKRQIASELLSFYKEKASLVITTKLHCALPCVAMGVPVVFFGDATDYRLDVLKDIGVTVNHYHAPDNKWLKHLYVKCRKNFAKSSFKNVNWNPEPLIFDEEKKAIIAKVSSMIAEAAQRHNDA